MEVRDHHKNSVQIVCITGMCKCESLNHCFNFFLKLVPTRNELYLHFLVSPTNQESRYWVISTENLRKDLNWVREVIFSIFIIIFIILSI